MFVLFETPAGFALFNVLDESKLQNPDNLWTQFQDIDKAKKIVELKSFSKFENTTEALSAITSLNESKLSKKLKKFLKESFGKNLKAQLAVSDPKLGGVIKEKLGIKCIHEAAIDELLRGIRSQMTNLIGGITESDMRSMVLGLSHSLSRYKVKFSPDKMDTMIVQAISLLDDLDKELNTYAMRVREWYGWHFPELTKVVPDNILYAKVVKKMGMRSNAAATDFSEILPDELQADVKQAAEVSMGTEVSEEDINNIIELATQVIDISAHREELFEYLKNRMNAIAPNLTVMVGELVGARLISHAGSLMNLAKHPASTVQILGAEKALFRALKTKHETPKYGLIYHASLIGQTAPKFKGKISRMLAAKCSLSARVDALGEKPDASIGIESRAKVEAKMRQCESGQTHSLSATKKRKAASPYQPPQRTSAYNSAADSTLTTGEVLKKSKKEEPVEAETPEKEKKKDKKEKKDKKDKKKKKEEDAEEMEVEAPVEEKKKDKKKKKEKKAEAEEEPEDNGSKKDKKKKKKSKD